MKDYICTKCNVTWRNEKVIPCWNCKSSANVEIDRYF